MQPHVTVLPGSLFPDDGDRSILVATDGHPHADTAFIAAAFIAGRVGGDVHVFSIVERTMPTCRGCKKTSGTPQVIGELQKACRTQEKIREELEMRRAMVETQIALTVGEAADWPITVRAGALDQTSQEIVVQSHAQLMVIGQCRQYRPGAPADACHATQLLTQRAIPIYIAAPTLRGVARRVVVAMDFSATSVHAAYMMSRLSAVDASVYLVHVLPHALAHELDERRHRLQRLARSLCDGSDLRVESVLLIGDAARETLGFADGIRADVIACGASSLPAFPSAHPCPPIMGRVTQAVMRQTACSVLIVPHVSEG